MFSGSSKFFTGFTIVELIVVTTIIGILATVTFVSFTNMTRLAIATSLESDLTSAATTLKLFQVENELFPETIDCNLPDSITNKCVKSSDSTIFNYSYNNSVNPPTFELTATKSDVSYVVTESLPATLVVAQAAASWKFVALGSYHTCAIDSDDKLYCWGRNSEGQLGDGTTDQKNVPVAVDTTGLLSGKTIKSVTAGYYHTCAIASDDNAYCWGGNTNGQLGNNSTSQSSLPVAVDKTVALNGKTVTKISAGNKQTCAIASDGKAYCWGYNLDGQLGDGTNGQKLVPTAVFATGALNGRTILDITSGIFHTCAVANNNLAYCWGYNFHGQLGTNNQTDSLVPIAINMTNGISALYGKTILSISTNMSTNCVVASDNKPYCWGFNSYGQVGNNTAVLRTIAAAAVNTTGVLSGKSISAVSVGSFHSCAIDTNGQAFCWGNNQYGQLGDDSVNQSLVPVTVSTAGVLNGKTLTSIKSGVHHTCAVATDEQIYCWGLGTSGQLGNDTIVQSQVPVLVSAP